jgi:hypothetical protein
MLVALGFRIGKASCAQMIMRNAGAIYISTRVKTSGTFL